jgi:hypothetical protein
MHAINERTEHVCKKVHLFSFGWGEGRNFFILVFPDVLNDVPQVANGFSMMFPKFLMGSPRVFLIACSLSHDPLPKSSFLLTYTWLSQRPGNLTAVRPSQVSVCFW